MRKTHRAKRERRFALLICLSMRGTALLGAQAAPREAPVEVAVPKAPIPVDGDGKRVLAYELHITNFGRQALFLESLEVFPSLTATRPIATFADSSLTAAFQVGANMRMAMASQPRDSSAREGLRIAAGERGIVFVWLTLALDDHLPQLLRHRLTFLLPGSAGQASTTRSTIDSLTTTVERDSMAQFATPMLGGEWLTGAGPSNSSPHRRTVIALHGRARISQRFAIDWVKIGPNGNSWHGDRSRNENFWGFGEPVRAVADGEVVAARDSITDNDPSKPLPSFTIANLAGNQVILRVGNSRYVMYAHLKHGSLRVRRGDRVKQGDVLALLGNTGQATAPHLHFQVMDAPSDLAAEGVPFVFDQFTFEGFGRDYEPDKPHPSVVKRREMPMDDAVVRFPGEAR
jgi:hypothetical protein